MSKIIKMDKWQNGGGVTLRIKHQYDSDRELPTVVSLDAGDVDGLIGFLQEYKAHPSPFCGPSCKVHGAPAQQESAEITVWFKVPDKTLEGGVTMRGRMVKGPTLIMPVPLPDTACLPAWSVFEGNVWKQGYTNANDIVLRPEAVSAAIDGEGSLALNLHVLDPFYTTDGQTHSFRMEACTGVECKYCACDEDLGGRE